jgi:nicotinamide mononucleotide transporter
MFLQVYFFATTVYGWWRWTHPRTLSETDTKRELRVSLLQRQTFLSILGATAAGAVALGFLVSRIHTILPSVFHDPAAFPFADTFVALFSVVAQILLSIKKREAWLLWIGVDILATVIYFLKGMLLMSIEYSVFCVIAVSGLLTWNAILRSYTARDGMGTEAAP